VERKISQNKPNKVLNMIKRYSTTRLRGVGRNVVDLRILLKKRPTGGRWRKGGTMDLATMHIKRGGGGEKRSGAIFFWRIHKEVKTKNSEASGLRGAKQSGGLQSFSMIAWGIGGRRHR